MILRQEGFDKSGPHQKNSHTKNERHQIARHITQARPEGSPFAPANECAAEDQPGLACDENCRYLE